MDARTLRLVGGLLLILALLLGLFTPPTAAGAVDGLPAIAQFKTAHVTLALAMARSTEPAGDFAYSGEGDIDNARQAARFSVVVAGATYDLVLVDGRLYARDPGADKWEWTESADSSASATDILGLGDPAAADADWRRVGAEQIDGAATTHWRAVLDTADVKRQAGTDRGATADPVEFAFDLSVDLWLGDANGYIYRYAVDLAMGDGGQASARPAGAGTLTLTYRVEFSRHDQPLDIQPPAGAVPAANGRAGGVLSGLPGRPAAGAAVLPLSIGSSRADNAGSPPGGAAATTTSGRNRIVYEPAPTRRGAAAAIATTTTVRSTTTVATTRAVTPTATATAALVAANPPGAAAPGVASVEVRADAGKGPGPLAIGLLAALLLGALGAFAWAFRFRAT